MTVVPRGLLAQRVLGRVQRAHPLAAQVGREHVAVAAAGAVAGLGERHEQLAVRRLAVRRKHVAVAEPQRVAHDRLRVARESGTSTCGG